MGWMDRTRRLWRTVVLGSLVWLLLCLVTACTGAPDREAEARQLEHDVAAMPGVGRAWVSYTNNFTIGANVLSNVQMREATGDEIAAVAARIGDAYRRHFGEFTRSVTFDVGAGTVDLRIDVSPERVAADARMVRRIRSEISSPIPDGWWIEWKRDESGAKLRVPVPDVPDGTVLAAVRSAVGEEPVRLDVYRGPSVAAGWSVEFPFRVEDEERVRNTLSRLPLHAGWVHVVGGKVSELTVAVSNPADAYRDLVSVIELMAPTPQHPLYLRWSQPNAPGTGDQRRFEGSVHAGGCSYSTGDSAPGNYYTDEAIALQKRLRTEYETCPK